MGTEPGAADAIAWRPTEEIVRASNWQAFLRAEGLPDYATLAARAEAEPEWFWDALIRFLDIRFTVPYRQVRDQSQGKPWTRWCVGGTTNLVLNCLDKHLAAGRGEHPAIVWEGEDGAVRRWTYRELNAETCRLAAGLTSLGLGRGDAIAIYMPMTPEAAAAFLAVAKIGGLVLPLFSGFGPGAVADRITDGGAEALLTADGTWRRGKPVDLKATVDEAARAAPGLRHVVVLRRIGLPVPMQAGRDHWWHELVQGRPGEAPTVEMPADDPLMVVYTSGTTGKPKGTVHTHCGFATKTAQDYHLCFDLKPSDRLLWMTDMGWLVGPIQVTAVTLAGATLVMAEGAPDYPDPGRLWRLVQDQRVTFLGITPTTARILKRRGDDEPARHDLSSLRICASTGEPWDPESWWWVFRRVCGGRVPLMNYSGGTEMGGIVASSVLAPIKPCSFAGPILGTGADIVDESGRPVPAGQVGELVMREVPIGLTRGLWREPDRYLESYWSRFPGLWVHGDWASRDADGMWYIHGRSDDTIKVAGKRTGPAEIEALLLGTRRVAEAAAVGVADPVKGTAVLCVCVPSQGEAPGEALADALREAVVAGLGPGFRPRQVLFVSDLPKTRNMKVMRRVIRAVHAGEPAGDLSSLVNPEAVEELRRTIGGISLGGHPGPDAR